MSRSLLTFAPVPMSSFGPIRKSPPLPIDEAEVAQRPEIAVDRRERHVERRPELVGADLAAVRDGQQEPEAAGERGVLGGFLGWPVARGGHAWSSGDSHSAGIHPGLGMVAPRPYVIRRGVAGRTYVIRANCRLG